MYSTERISNGFSLFRMTDFFRLPANEYNSVMPRLSKKYYA